MTVAAMPATTTPTTRRPKLNTVRPDDKPIRTSRPERPDPAPQAPFVKFRVDVLTDGSLSASARIVYALLVHHHSKERGCFPGRDLLADELGASIPTVDRVLNELCAAKLIVKKRQGRGHNNTYSFPLESSVVMTQVVDDSSSVIVQPDESSLVSTPESSPVRSPESSVVMTPYVTRTKEQEPTKQDEYIPRTNEIVRWFARRVGGVVSKPGSNPWNHARDLAEAGATDADLEGTFVWLQGEAWVKSISLTLMAAKFNDYKSTLPVAKPVDDENPKLKGGMGLYWARERKRLVIARAGCKLESEMPKYDERIAESEANLLAVGVSVQEAETWAQRH